MKRTIRIIALLLIVSVAIVGLFSEPTEPYFSAKWLGVLIATKAVGVAGLFLSVILAQRWQERGLL